MRQLRAAGCEKVFREKITGTTARSGPMPLHFAVCGGQEAAVRQAMAERRRFRPLGAAAAKGQFDPLRSLVPAAGSGR